MNFNFKVEGASHHHLSLTFRVSQPLVSRICSEVCQAIWKVMQPELLSMPNAPNEWELIANDFWSRCNAPLVCGSIDGKHILLKKPSHSGSVFYNYKGEQNENCKNLNFKGTTSLVLLAICNAQYKFIYTDIGFCYLIIKTNIHRWLWIWIWLPSFCKLGF